MTNIDPAGNYDYGSFALGVNTLEHLYDARNGAKIVPSLATNCAPVGTAKTWRCTLRRGVKFHDGSDFDSADVKFSFDRVIKINDPSGISSLLSALKSVKTNGRYAVTFNLKAPVSTWRFILASGAGGIVPSDAYPANRLQANNQPQIGTGPYRLTRYTPGQQAVFERFDDYWGPKAKNEGLIIRYYAKSSTMKLALQRGEIDMAFQTFTPTELASPATDRPSLAVLPFSNLSCEPDLDHLCEGLAEDIITGLGRFRFLFVIDRYSSSAIAKQDSDIAVVDLEIDIAWLNKHAREKVQIEPQVDRYTMKSGRHLLVLAGSILVVELVGYGTSNVVQRPRPFGVEILTDWQTENIAAAMQRLKDVFATRYPGARCHVHVYGGDDRLRFEVSYHARSECVIGVGDTPEEMFRDLDAKVGPPDLPERDRLQRRVDQLIRDAVTAEAHEVLRELQAWKATLTCPGSSPGTQ